MADSLTANYNLIKPEIGGSQDTWGSKLNVNFDQLDSIIKDIQEIAESALTEDGKAKDSEKLDGKSLAYVLDAGNLTGTLPNDVVSDTRLAVYGKTITDWNAATESGWYKADGASNAPGGASSWFFGHVVAQSDGYVEQEVIGIVLSGRPRYRRHRNNGTWSAWERAYTGAGELEGFGDTQWLQITADNTIGLTFCHGTPTNAAHLVNKNYVDTKINAIPAPNYAAGIAAMGTGGVGTYALLQYFAAANTAIQPSTLVSGSQLYYSNAADQTIPNAGSGVAGPTLAPGTWRCMGFINKNSGNGALPVEPGCRTALFLRVS